MIGSYDDLCPLCQAQGEVYFLAVIAEMVAALDDLMEADTVLEGADLEEPTYDPVLFN